jgi:type IV pilus assembly protein PilC
MAQFQWEGTTSKGEFKMGLLEGATQQDVERKLKEMGIVPTRVQKKATGFQLRMPWAAPVKIKTLVVFSRQLATMIDAGLPLVQCLEILSQQEPDPMFQKILTDVKTSVEAGNTFADALKKHPRVFDDLFCNLVAAGEMGGVLDSILNRLAAYTEKAAKLRDKVKGTLKYPTTIFVVALGITAFMLIKVVPTFADIFRSMGKAELPGLTQLIINISEKFTTYFPVFVVIMAALVGGLVYMRRTPWGSRILDNFQLHLPLIGVLVQKNAIAKFTRTLGTLLASGVPILDALDIVAKSSGNRIVEEGILYTKDKISEGKSIAVPLMEKGIFPRMVVQMIAVGESTGALDIMLNKIADFYEDEVDVAVDSLTSLLEPLVMIVVGGLIGFILVAMYLPIFTLADTIKTN